MPLCCCAHKWLTIFWWKVPFRKHNYWKLMWRMPNIWKLYHSIDEIWGCTTNWFPKERKEIAERNESICFTFVVLQCDLWLATNEFICSWKSSRLHFQVKCYCKHPISYTVGLFRFLWGRSRRTYGIFFRFVPWKKRVCLPRPVVSCNCVPLKMYGAATVISENATEFPKRVRYSLCFSI